MTKMRLYTIRLALGIGVAGLVALACTALLDTGSLNTIKREAGATDATTEGTKPPDGPKPPPDLGKCVPGAMTCTQAVGACRNGTRVCYETTSVCKPGAPAAEKCDGTDSNCNGKGDIEEPEAVAQCKAAGQFCDGTKCVAGCYDNSMCTNGNTCNTTSHKCACGTLSFACSAPKKCLNSACVCGANNIICGSGETCDPVNNLCACGDTKSPTGKACGTGLSCSGTPPTCKPTTDMGPDKGQPDKPPVIIDQKVIDQKVIDQKVIDQKVIDQPQPIPDQTVTQ
jgi:hypothetical protein